MHRIGCYDSGEKDWDAPEVRLGLAEYARYAKLSATPSVADSALLDSLKSRRDRLCPLECGAGEVPVNGRCVAAGPRAAPRLTAAREAERPAATRSTVPREERAQAPCASRDQHLAKPSRPAFGRRPAATASASMARNTASDVRVWTAYSLAHDCLRSMEPRLAEPSPRGSIQLPGSGVRALPRLLDGCRDCAPARRRLPRQLQHRPGLGDRSSIGNGHPADRDARRAGAPAQCRPAKPDRGGATHAQGGLLRVQRASSIANNFRRLRPISGARTSLSGLWALSARCRKRCLLSAHRSMKSARGGGDSSSLPTSPE